MKLRMRFTNSGLMGAVLFIASILLGGFLYAAMLARLSRGTLSAGIEAEPFTYVVLTTIGAFGFVMMLSGRELVSAEIIENERQNPTAE